MNDIVPRETLSRQGTAGFMAAAGGVGVLLTVAIPVIGWVVGGVLTLGGLAVSRKKADRGVGLAATAVGALVLATAIPLPVIKNIANAALWISGIGLVVAGGLSIYRFFRGLKSRS